MTISDDDPAYIVRFKDSFTADLKNREQNLNLLWLNVVTALDPRFKHLKCVAKENRDRVWMEVQKLVESIMMRETADSTAPEPPRKRPRFYELSSDSEDESLMHQATNAKAVLQRYRTEPNVDSDICPLGGRP